MNSAYVPDVSVGLGIASFASKGFVAENLTPFDLGISHEIPWATR